MTEIFIYVTFGIIVIYDIIAVIAQQKYNGKKIGLVTITSVFRGWYNRVPLVPYMVGGVFLGHFGFYRWNTLLPVNVSLWVFIIVSLIIITWCIVNMVRGYKGKAVSKLYKVFSFFPVSMTTGLIIGSFWR